jgi:hypothetical protein
MKRSTILMFLISQAFASAWAADGTAPRGENAVIRLSEAVAVSATHETFGALLAETGRVLRLSEIIHNADAYVDTDVVLTTRIAKVCQRKGCFFIATDGAATARVTFEDYGFFIPTDSAGKRVTLAGTFTRTEVDAEQAEHYAADLGEAPAGRAGGPEYAIVATSVRIPRN